MYTQFSIWLATAALVTLASASIMPDTQSLAELNNTTLVPVTETEVQVSTIYTTTSVEPIYWTTVLADASTYTYTSLSTTTRTITSCHSGCSEILSQTDIPETTEIVTTFDIATIPILDIPLPSPSTATVVYTISEIFTVTEFVPCSTTISIVDQMTYLSTWLSLNFLTSTQFITTTEYQTFFATATVEPNVCPSGFSCVTLTAGGGGDVPMVTVTGTVPDIEATATPYQPGQAFSWTGSITSSPPLATAAYVSIENVTIVNSGAAKPTGRFGLFFWS